MFSLLLLCLVVVSCKNDRCTYPNGIEHIYCPFSSDTALIPYHGLDTLEFLKISGSDTETVLFYGQGKKYYTNTEQVDNEPCIREFEYEAYEIIFRNADTTGNIGEIRFALEVIHPMLFSSFKVQINEREFSKVTYFTIDYPNYSGYVCDTTLNGYLFRNASRLQIKNESTVEKLFISREGIVLIELSDFTLQLIK